MVFYITDMNWTQELGKCEEYIPELEIDLFISQNYFQFQVQDYFLNKIFRLK